MTAREFLAVLRRRWYVVVVGVALTLASGVLLLGRAPVFYTEFDVVVLPPAEPPRPNTLRASVYGLAPMAGILVRDFNHGDQPVQMATPEATIYGQGVRQGHMVRQRNTGSQWQPTFTDPVIEVQVVHRTPEEVMAESHRIIARLDRLLARRQAALGIQPQWRMTTEPSPSDPVVSQVTGSRVRTAASAVLLGGSLTLIAAYWLERLSRLRRRIPRFGDPGRAAVPGARRRAILQR